MKKILTVIAVGVIGVCANAASVSWQIGNARIPIADNLTISQTGIQTTTSSEKFAADALSITLLYLNGSDWTTITTAKTTAEGVKAATDFWSQAEAEANRDSSGNAYFKIIAQYTDAQGGVYDFNQESGAVSLANIASKAVKVTFNMNNGTWDYTAASVPEPTSGLLMLVGLAGLALRRRRA